jgi:MoaA/NifB/PqqE/SkfB family radical SAM enzyme
MDIYPTQIANFAVTYRCNSRCSYCYIWKKNDHESELSLHEIESLFRNNYDILKKVSSIQLTGGEPFLRPDLPDITKVIHDILPKCFIWIPTNGLIPEKIHTMVGEILQDVKSLGISISIDGIGAEHDKQRGLQGSYQKSLETLKILSNYRREYSNLSLSVGFTLSPYNIDEALKVHQLAIDYDADFSLRPVNTSEIYYGITEKPLYNQELLDVLHALSKSSIKRKGWQKSITFLSFLRGIPQFLRDPKRRPVKCSAGSKSFFLDPYGNLYPCIALNYRIGNIRDTSFQDLWFSKRADKVRENISKMGCPGCWVECETFREIKNNKMFLIETLLSAFLKRDFF